MYTLPDAATLPAPWVEHHPGSTEKPLKATAEADSQKSPSGKEARHLNQKNKASKQCLYSKPVI